MSSEKPQYDIREDEEQNVKLQEIIDLLVAAGYFRARIKGLSAFDKVVGGMIWCMESCNFDVNVDILFQENSTIGQKIGLTEKIVTVLPKMECPHRIEPHQIQGLDFIHVFPVIQWLVKRSVIVREEKKEFIRAHAVQEFSKLYDKPKFQGNIIENVSKVQELYRRRRLYKRKDSPPEKESLRVESTLMEYGLLGEVGGADNDMKTAPCEFFQESQELEESVSSKLVGNIVSSQVEKLAKVSEKFAKLQDDVEGSGAQKHREMLHENKETFLQQKHELEEEIKKDNEKLKEIREKIASLNINQDEMQNENSLRAYKKLEGLLLLEENLKEQEVRFREHCKTELARLQQLVQEAAERESSQESTKVTKESDEERERVHSLRLQSAKVNRQTAFLQRQLDEVPGRGELAQYQRRFLELYSQVSQTHEETKQFYTLYNTLTDTKLYVSKELSLLNSVLDNYSKAMSNALDKEEFMTQFESIVTAIKQNKVKVEKKRTEARAKRDKLSQQLLELIEQQRNYVAVVRQLKIECKRNEVLLSHFRGS